MKYEVKLALITLVSLILLVLISQKVPDTFWENIGGHILRISVAYVFAIPIGWLFTKLVVDEAWMPLDLPGSPRPSPYYSGILGCLERALYVTAFLLNQFVFVGVWLALKVAGAWKRWNEEEKGGRVVFTVFLMGNAMSLGYAFVGSQFTEWLPKAGYRWLVVFVPTLLILASFGTRYWVRKEANAHLERQKNKE